MKMKRLCGAVIAGLMLVPAAAYGLQNQPTTQSASDARAADREAIEAILEKYKGAIARLDARGTEKLFEDRKRVGKGKSVTVSVNLGGSRIMNKQKNEKKTEE